MKELIRIRQYKDQQVVNARELHDFLEIGKDFSTWIKNRIVKYGFIENQDFTLLPNFGEKSSFGRPCIEYAITLDMAKELAMVENNQQGRIARKYFIICEKKLRENTTLDFSNPDTVLQLAQNWHDEQMKRLQAEATIRENAPKVRFAESLIACKSSILIGELAKILKQNGCNIGQNRLFEWLRTNGYLGKFGNNYNIPTQRTMDMGLFEISKTIVYIRGDLVDKTTTKVTEKGQMYFINKFLKLCNK